MTNKYKVIFLDWSGTLSKSKFWGHLQSSNDRDLSLFNKMEEALFSQSKELLNPWMRGEYRSEDICEVVAEKTGVAYKLVFDEFVKGCKLMEICSLEVPKLLQSIKETGAMIVIATDNMDSFKRWTWPMLQEKYTNLFDGVLSSSELKVMKEDTTNDANLFFDKYLKDNGLSYRECLLIDDSPDKKGIFSQIGLDYIQVLTTEKFIASLKKLTNKTGV